MAEHAKPHQAALLAHLQQRAGHAQQVLQAMAQVPRELFVPPKQRAHAYADKPLAIGDGQTISQPTVVAHMLGSLNLRAGDKVLEVGTGSGYQAALLQVMGAKVYSLEVRPELAEAASKRLEAGGFADVRVQVGDAGKGWPDAAPFAAIVVACAASRVPDALLEQLQDGGYLVMPVGAKDGVQQLERWQRRGEAFRQETLGAVRFVPWTTTRQLQLLKA